MVLEQVPDAAEALLTQLGGVDAGLGRPAGVRALDRGRELSRPQAGGKAAQQPMASQVASVSRFRTRLAAALAATAPKIPVLWKPRLRMPRLHDRPTRIPAS